MVYLQNLSISLQRTLLYEDTVSFCKSSSFFILLLQANQSCSIGFSSEEQGERCRQFYSPPAPLFFHVSVLMNGRVIQYDAAIFEFLMLA